MVEELAVSLVAEGCHWLTALGTHSFLSLGHLDPGLLSELQQFPLALKPWNRGLQERCF